MSELNLDELEKVNGGTDSEFDELYAAIRRNPNLMNLYKAYHKSNVDIHTVVMLTIKTALNCPVRLNDGSILNSYGFGGLSHQQVLRMLAKF